MSLSSNFNNVNSFSSAQDALPGLMNSFSQAAQPSVSTQPNVLESAMGKGQTVMQKLSNTNHMGSIPKVNLSSLKPEIGKSITNSAGLAATAQTTRDQVAKVGNNFTAEVKSAQSSAYQAMKQGADNLGIDLGAAKATIIPQASSTHVGAGLSLGADMMTGGGVAMASAGISALNDISRQSKQLPPAKVAALMDEMQCLLTPQPNPTGGAPTPPAIDSNFDFTAIDSKEFEELMKPSGQHPEAQEIDGILVELDNEILPLHDKIAQDEFNVVTADKVADAMERGDTSAIEEMSTDEAPAPLMAVSDNNELLAKVAPELVEQEKIEAPDLSSSEILMNSEFLATLKGVDPTKESANDITHDISETELMEKTARVTSELDLKIPELPPSFQDNAMSA